MTLSETIRRAIQRDGRSLYQLAIDSGVSRGQLVRFANAERELTLPAATRLCAALGLVLVRRPRKDG